MAAKKDKKRARSAGVRTIHPCSCLSYHFKGAYQKALSRKNTCKNISPRRNSPPSITPLTEPESVKQLSKVQLAQYKRHVLECMRGLSYVNGVVKWENYRKKKVNVPNTSNKLAVFDLDETLIHTLNDDEVDSDSDGPSDSKYDVKVEYFDEDGPETVYVNIRPYVVE